MLMLCMFPEDGRNDPSAGSPTETLLQLLLPLDSPVWVPSRCSVGQQWGAGSIQVCLDVLSTVRLSCMFRGKPPCSATVTQRRVNMWCSTDYNPPPGFQLSKCCKPTFLHSLWCCVNYCLFFSFFPLSAYFLLNQMWFTVAFPTLTDLNAKNSALSSLIWKKFNFWNNAEQISVWVNKRLDLWYHLYRAFKNQANNN